MMRVGTHKSFADCMNHSARPFGSRSAWSATVTVSAPDLLICFDTVFNKSAMLPMRAAESAENVP